MSRIFVMLGKNGDQLSVLPILQHEYNLTGEKQTIMVSKQYSSLLQRVSFAKSEVFDGSWQDLKGAIRYAKQHFNGVIVPQTFGKDFPIQHKTASFQLDQWLRAGYLDKWDTLPLTLPRPKNAKAIAKKHLQGKPTILFGDHSQSSPFPHREEFAKLLQHHFSHTHQIIRLSTIQLEHPLDLLALYDAADLLVSIETMHLHLSKATSTPVIALATDTPTKWHGSANSRRFRFYAHYGEWEHRKTELIQAAKAALAGAVQTHYSKSGKEIIRVRRTAAIGDALAASVVADRLKEHGYEVEFQTHPDIHCVLKRQPGISKVTTPKESSHINLDGVYERDPKRTEKHFHTMFMEHAASFMAGRGKDIGNKFNCKPVLVVTPEERQSVALSLQEHAKPWVFICPRSDSHNTRTVPDHIWKRAAPQIRGTKFWLGRNECPAGIVDLKVRTVEDVLLNLSVADVLVTPDTGPMHIAAALSIPVVAIEQSSSPELHLSDQRDFVVIKPTLDCLNCQQYTCPLDKETPPCQSIDPGLIASAVNARLGAKYEDKVSAVVAIYKPKVEILNRGLRALIPQVEEIIVCSDQAGEVPVGALQHPKIRYVKSRERDIGYGRKANYGARHTNGKYLLFHNDDVELHPDAVAKMKVEMVPDVGIVSCLLRYPDGTIQHAGKTREPNIRGWGHIDHRKLVPTFKQAVESENTCGACILVRREAFYKAGAHDEDFRLYCEDDALCLAVRREGYRIVFTPFAQGVHDEHLSTEKTPGIVKTMHESNAIFERKWGPYLEWNKNRCPMGNFDYLKSCAEEKQKT